MANPNNDVKNKSRERDKKDVTNRAPINPYLYSFNENSPEIPGF